MYSSVCSNVNGTNILFMFVVHLFCQHIGVIYVYSVCRIRSPTSVSMLSFILVPAFTTLDRIRNTSLVVATGRNMAKRNRYQNTYKIYKIQDLCSAMESKIQRLLEAC